jgi:hypothetical protein
MRRHRWKRRIVADPIRDWDGVALTSSGKFTMDEMKQLLAEPEMEAFDRLPKWARDAVNERGGRVLAIAVR